MLKQQEYDLLMIRLSNANIDLGNGVDMTARTIIEANKSIGTELEKAKKEFLEAIDEWNRYRELEDK